MPTVPRDWADPFLEQAREDLAAAWVLVQSDQSDQCASSLCMLLQMVFEKLAKAAYARGGAFPPHVHNAASHLFRLLDRHPAGKALLTASPHVQQFVMDLENAHPNIAGRQTPPWPQLEYPWEDTRTGTVQ